MLKKSSLALAALAMTAAPVAASAATAKNTPAQRASAQAEEESDLRGDSIAPLIMGAIIIGMGTYLLIEQDGRDDDDDDDDDAISG